MLTYPGDPIVAIEQHLRHAQAATCPTSRSSLSSTHTGTHVDPPIHFVEDGATIDALALDALVGPAHVVDMRGVGSIGASELDAPDLPDGVDRLLFLTDWSARWAERRQPSRTP